MSGFFPPSSRHVFASRRAAHLAGSGEAHDCDIRMRHQRCARFLAKAVQRRIDALWHARFTSEYAEGPCREGRVLCRLQNRGVTTEQRRKGFPGHVRNGRVRRNDETCNSQGLSDDHCRLVRHRTCRRLAVEPAAFAGHEKAHLDRGIRLAKGVLARLSRFACDQFGNGRPVLTHQQCNLPESVAALHDGIRGPRRLCRQSRLDGVADIGGIRSRDFANHATGRGIDFLERSAFRRKRLTTTDEVGNNGRNRGQIDGGRSCCQRYAHINLPSGPDTM
jgi:hypothetical protein